MAHPNVLFFSGGIDSATLAFDVAMHPHRYGIPTTPESRLHLVSVGDDAKRAALAPLVEAMSDAAVIGVDLDVRPDGLMVFHEGDPYPEGGAQTLNPILTRYPSDVAAIPYTPGWMLWMAAVAVNLLAPYGADHFNPPQAFLAHQWNGPVWEAIDAGKMDKFDATPAFYRHVQAAMDACGERVRIRCPFLENRMDRVMIVRLALELGVPLEMTSSCLRGWKAKCGMCHACYLRQGAFRSLGLEIE